MKNIYLTENQMNIIRDSITPVNQYGEEPLDKFEGLSDDEFMSSFDSPEEAEVMKKLLDLADEGSTVFQLMKNAIMDSPYYQNNMDKMKPYLDKIEEINEKLANLWY